MKIRIKKEEKKKDWKKKLEEKDDDDEVEIRKNEKIDGLFKKDQINK